MNCNSSVKIWAREAIKSSKCRKLDWLSENQVSVSHTDQQILASTQSPIALSLWCWLINDQCAYFLILILTYSIWLIFIWAQTIRGDISMKHCLSLAKPMHASNDYMWNYQVIYIVTSSSESVEIQPSLSDSFETQPQCCHLLFFIHSIRNVDWPNVVQALLSGQLTKRLMMTLIQYQVYLLPETARQLSFDPVNFPFYSVHITQLRIQTTTLDGNMLTLCSTPLRPPMCHF